MRLPATRSSTSARGSSTPWPNARRAATVRLAATRNERRFTLFRIRCAARQRKHVQRVVGAVWLDARLVDDAGGVQPDAGQHGHVLLAVDGIGDRAVLHRTIEPLLPQYLAAVAVEGAEHMIEITPEHDVTRRRQHRTVRRRVLLE